MRAGFTEQSVLFAWFEPTLTRAFRAHIELHDTYAATPEGTLVEKFLCDAPIQKVPQPREQPVTSDHAVRAPSFSHRFDVRARNRPNRLQSKWPVAGAIRGHLHPAEDCDVVPGLLRGPASQVSAIPGDFACLSDLPAAVLPQIACSGLLESDTGFRLGDERRLLGLEVAAHDLCAQPIAERGSLSLALRG